MTESKPTPRLPMPGTGVVPFHELVGMGRAGLMGTRASLIWDMFEIVVFMEHQNGEICEVVEEDIKTSVVRQEAVGKNHKACVAAQG